jgi:methyl-accepting chemotaxis protein
MENDARVLRKDFNRVRNRATLITATVFFFPQLLLAPFAFLSGYLGLDDLLTVLGNPLITGILLINVVAFFFIHHFNILRGIRLFLSGNRDWEQARSVGKRILYIFYFAVFWEILLANLILEIIVGFEFPNSVIITSGYILAFIAMVSAPLILTMLNRYELLVRQHLDDERRIFSLRFKMISLTAFVFIGTSLMFLSLQETVSIATGVLGRTLPVPAIMTSLIASAVALGALMFLLVQLSRYILNPLNEMVEKFEVGASGDFRQSVKATSTDEIGVLSIKMNRLFSSLNDSIKQVSSVVTDLQEAKVQLGTGVESMAGSVLQINDNLMRTNNQMEDHSSNVIETTAAVEELARNIDSLGDNILAQTKTIHDSESSISELVGANTELQTLTDESHAKVSELVSQSAEGGTRLQTMAGRIEVIIENSKHLIDANQLIAAVASQTNLLAMNAAIEAAHAGEAGRGFAVVADEIRKLAETATNQSKNISQNLKVVLHDIGSIGEESREMQESFKGISITVDGVQRVIDRISNFMNTVQSFSSSLQSALGEIEDVTQNVSTGSHEMRQGNSEILVAMTNMKEISQKVSDAVKEITSQATSISQSSESMKAQNERTDQALDNLRQVIGRFKYE